MKKFVLGLIIGIIISTSVFAGTTGLYKGFETVKIFVDNKELVSNNPAVIIDGKVYASANELSNALGAHSSFNPNTRELNIQNSLFIYPTSVKVDNLSPKQSNIIFEIDENNNCNEIYFDLGVLNECVAAYKFEDDTSLTITSFLQSFVQAPSTKNIQTGTGVFAKINEKKLNEKIYYLYADDEDHTYLGKITSNQYDSESIFNEYGKYGSKYQSNSIWNTYGTYGSKYNNYSPFNKYTSTPPIIIDSDNNIIGRLTVNDTLSDAISPYAIYTLIE